MQLLRRGKTSMALLAYAPGMGFKILGLRLLKTLKPSKSEFYFLVIFSLVM